MIASPSGSQTPARNSSPREAELGWASANAKMTPEDKKEEKNLDAGALHGRARLRQCRNLAPNLVQTVPLRYARAVLAVGLATGADTSGNNGRRTLVDSRPGGSCNWGRYGTAKTIDPELCPFVVRRARK